MLKILFEDDLFIALDKPAGLASDQTKDPRRDSALSLLKQQRPELKPVLLHRLDRDTSGTLLFCIHPEFNEVAASLFRERRIRKEYLCLVRGSFPKIPMLVKNHLKLEKINARQGRMIAVRSGGQLAMTEFHFQQASSEFSLIQALPQTGRTHQIRVHSADLGFPIVGDRIYGKMTTADARLFLHAHRLIFVHPKTESELVIEAPVPKEFFTRLKK